MRNGRSIAQTDGVGETRAAQFSPGVTPKSSVAPRREQVPSVHPCVWVMPMAVTGLTNGTAG